MLSHLLLRVREYERIHGVAPNAICINPMHFEVLFRECPGLFDPDPEISLGFRIIIVPSCRQAHPEVLRLEKPPSYLACATTVEPLAGVA